jgi:hypothetical protein
LQHADDGLVVAFATELEESARLAVFGVGFEVALFGEQREDVEIFLKAALVVQVAENLLCAGRRGRCDILAAARAFGDFVRFEEAIPVQRTLAVRWRRVYRNPNQWKWHPQLICTSSGTVSGAAAGALPEDDAPFSYSSSSSRSISTSRGLLQATQTDIFAFLSGLGLGLSFTNFGGEVNGLFGAKTARLHDINASWWGRLLHVNTVQSLLLDILGLSVASLLFLTGLKYAGPVNTNHPPECHCFYSQRRQSSKSFLNSSVGPSIHPGSWFVLAH